jgi:hypothetical protein
MMSKFCLVLVRTLLVLAVCPLGRVAAAQDVCSPPYEAALQSLQQVATRGLRTSLTNKVESAWKQSLIGGRGNINAASQKLNAALRELQGQPGTKALPPDDRAKLVDLIAAFRTCVQTRPPSQTATLSVHTFAVSDVAPGNKGAAAGAGVVIFVDDVEVGVTDGSGVATVQVPARQITVTARLYPSSEGRAQLSLLAGQVASIDIVLDDGKELAAAADLELVEAPSDVLERAFSTFTLRFVDPQDATVPLTDLDSVLISDTFGGPQQNITQLFSRQADGSIRATNSDALRTLLLARSGAIQLNVHGEADQNRQYDGTSVFFVGSFRVVGQLVAPPSFPGLALGGIIVRASILNTSLIFTAVSDASGSFEFPLLPPGNLEFKGETLQVSKYYYGQGIFVINGSKRLTVNMLNTADLVAGVTPFTVTPF